MPSGLEARVKAAPLLELLVLLVLLDSFLDFDILPPTVDPLIGPFSRNP
jgi:hypothetical protein